MIYPWQQTQWQQINDQYQQQRMAQALLLTGIEGLGQAEFAQETARLLLCETPTKTACGHCRQCHLIATGVHPDLLYMQPEQEGRVIKIEQIREAIDRVAKTPQLAARQVVIINALDQLNIKSANALLKTLEEPSGDVVFILICYRLGSVPVTILSRCQKLHFSVRDGTQALSWLQQQCADHSQLEVLLKLAFGAPLKAQQMAEKNILALRDQCLKKLLGTAEGHPLKGVDELLKHNIHDLLLLFRTLLDDIRRCQLGVSEALLTHSDRVRPLERCAQQYSQALLQRRLDQVQQIERALTDGIHLNLQLAIEGLVIEESWNAY